MSGVLRAHGVTDKGTVRSINEDCFAIDDRLSLCIVADGMGGHNAGEIAARIAVNAVRDVCREGLAAAPWPYGFDPALSEHANLLRTSVHVASVRVLEAAGTNEGYAGMGTTIAAALVRGGRVSVAHAGDSRVYVFAGGRLRLLTRDDSWVQDVLSQNPHADPAMLRHHPMRHALTNVVGAETWTEVHVTEEPLADGALLALTTDGVHGAIDHRQFASILAGRDPSTMAADLVATALANGARDNCTAVVASYRAES